DVDDEDFVYFYHLEAFYRVPRKDYERIYSAFKAETDTEHNEVVDLGGLHIVGTERHEARRIDNQLRGGAGRQGDPGSSRFYLSLPEDLMRIFGPDSILGLMQKLGMEEGVPIEAGTVWGGIERAQKQVEAQNFSVRKHLLEYDDVMNKQRENIYALRRQLLEGSIKLTDENDQEEVLDSRAYIMMLAEDLVDSNIQTFAPRQGDFETWDLDALRREVSRIFALDTSTLDFSNLTSDEIRDLLWEHIQKSYTDKEALVGREILQRVERDVMLQVVDVEWKDHLYSLDHLKEGIGLRGYGQRDPLVEYKKESFELFQGMKDRVDEKTVAYMWGIRPVRTDEADGSVAVAAPRRPAPRPPERRALQLNDPAAETAAASVFAPPRRQQPAFAGAAAAPARGSAPTPARVGGDDAAVKTVRRDEPKVGR